MNALTLLVDAANSDSGSSAKTSVASDADDVKKHGKKETSDSKQKGPVDGSASPVTTVLPGAANTFAAALAARENAMYQHIHHQQGAAANLRYLEEVRKEEEKLSKDRLATIMLQQEREQQQAAAQRATIMQLIGENPTSSAPIGTQSPQETEYLQQLHREALVQQRRQETLAKLAISKEMESSSGSRNIPGADIGKNLSRDVASHKYQRQDSALHKAILMARADEELLKQRLEHQQKAQEQKEIEHQLQQEHQRQEHQKAIMLQMISNRDDSSVLAKALLAAAGPVGPPYPGSGASEENAILQLLEKRKRQRLMTQHFPNNQQPFLLQSVASSTVIPSIPSTQYELQQKLQHHLQAQQQIHGSRSERADLIGSVFAKASTAAASTNHNNHDRAASAHTSSIPPQVLSAIAVAEENQKQQLLKLQQHRHNSQESFQSSGMIMDTRSLSSRQLQQHEHLRQQALAHPQQQAAALIQQQQGSIKLNREIQQAQDVVNRDAAFRDSKSTILPCRARGMPMDHNVKTAYFVIPQDIKHGTELLCSYFACRNAGIKFRYCVFCKLPVAKRNFAKRHRHSGKIPESEVLKDSVSDDTADNSVDDEPAPMCTLATPQKVLSPQKGEPNVDGDGPSGESKVDASNGKNASQKPVSTIATSTLIKTSECNTDNPEEAVDTTISAKVPSIEDETSKTQQDATMINPQPMAIKQKLVRNDAPLISSTPTTVISNSKRQRAWEELLLQRPKTKLPNSDAMSAWIQEVLRVSDFEREIDSVGSYMIDSEVQGNGDHLGNGVANGTSQKMRPLSSKKSKTKALLSRKEQEDMEEKKGDADSNDVKSSNESDALQRVEEVFLREDNSTNASRKRDAVPDDLSTSSEESVDLRIRKKHRN